MDYTYNYTPVWNQEYSLATGIIKDCPPNTIGCCNEAPTQAPDYTLTWKQRREQIKKEQKEKDMTKFNTIQQTVSADMRSEAERQREKLLERMYTIRNEKRSALPDKFNINGLPSPKTPAELRDYLAKGFFTIEGEKENKFPEYVCWPSAISWRDPSKPADRDGLKAAQKALDDMYTDKCLDIIIESPTDGLATLRAFQAAN